LASLGRILIRLAALVLIAFGMGAGAVGHVSAAEDQVGRRVALVVGNSAYSGIEPLKNAVRDADAIAEMLEQLGFEVLKAGDVSLAEFEDTLDSFVEMAEGADAALFYYSGHGFQLGGVNHLVPVDARLSSREAIGHETLRLDDIIARVHARNRQTLIFLDACRNNPLPASLRDAGGDGLAQIETGSGVFVAFATQPGNITRDGAGDHSPFTAALLKHLPEPGISISDMMIRVRNEVEKETLHTQTPWDQSSLRSQFYFNPQEEPDAILTQEDRELLLSLDPELRAKFEQRFNIRIVPGDEAPDEPLVATIQPRFKIRRAEQETSGLGATPAEGAPAAAQPQPVGRFRIVPARQEAPDQEVAALQPEEETAPELPEQTADIPLPQFRPSPSQPAEPAQQVARLDRAGPIMEAGPEEALMPGPAAAETARPALPSSDRVLPHEEQERVEQAAPHQADHASEMEVALALPVTGGALTAPAAERMPESAERAAPLAVLNRSTGLSLQPAFREAPRIVGKEIAPDQAAGESSLELAALDPDALKKAPTALPGADLEPEEPAAIVPLAPEYDEREMARLIQAELQRLGCYRSGIDGIWGPNSARALLRYFATKKEEPDELEPNPVLLSRLKAEERVICTHTEVAPEKKRQIQRTRQEQPVARNQRPSQPAATSQTGRRSSGSTASTSAPDRKISRKLKIGGFR
jgi:hypothetical protein